MPSYFTCSRSSTRLCGAGCSATPVTAQELICSASVSLWLACEVHSAHSGWLILPPFRVGQPCNSRGSARLICAPFESFRPAHSGEEQSLVRVFQPGCSVPDEKRTVVFLVDVFTRLPRSVSSR